MNEGGGHAELNFICPACRVTVTHEVCAYTCQSCGRVYPVLFGIPDFRIRPDRYLSISDERGKASRLYNFGQTASFERLVDYYYSITDDVPPELAKSFARYVRDAPVRADGALKALGGTDTGGKLLDVGCGSGGALLAAKHHFAVIIGVDIGMRWLVIAQKRLTEGGGRAILVCADIEALPFADEGFDRVIADDVIEHAYSPLAATTAVARQVAPGGKLLISAINRNWIGPHPAVGLWAAGLMPARLRSRIIFRMRGIDALRNMGFVSPSAVIRAGRRAGVGVEMARARAFGAQAVAGRSPGFRRLAVIYAWFGSSPVLRNIIFWVGPTFEIVFRRQVESKGDYL
ncbi:hypothetical protein BH09PSE3_BH09PSE3_00240 [soil metagenome]